jgi:hypothetical protein
MEMPGLFSCMAHQLGDGQMRNARQLHQLQLYRNAAQVNRVGVELPGCPTNWRTFGLTINPCETLKERICCPEIKTPFRSWN